VSMSRTQVYILKKSSEKEGLSKLKGSSQGQQLANFFHFHTLFSLKQLKLCAKKVTDSCNIFHWKQTRLWFPKLKILK
jgi:hypothetical protein